MRYIEIKENYKPEEDDSNKVEISDTRVTRLTLIHLSRLRNIREYRKYENSKRNERLKDMYGGSADGDGMGDLGGDLEL